MILPRKKRFAKKAIELALAYSIFCSTFLHHVGNDDYYGKPFDLESWQWDLIWKPLFATGRFIKGIFRRKYRRALIGLPRNYGKTELAAALILTITGMEPIHNGQYGVIASTKEQASNCFKKLKSMIRLDPTLDALWDCQKNIIVNRENGSEIRIYAYGEDTVQSWHMNVCILDELHVYKDGSVWEAIIAGQKGIPNALAIGITTASGARSGFLWDLLNKDDDDAFYKLWIGLDDKDDFESEKCWEKLCLPSWVNIEDIKDQRKSLTLAKFVRYVLNVFAKEKIEEAAFDEKKIDKCITKEDFDWSRQLTLGLDAAVSGDCFAQGYSYFEGSDCHVYPIIFEAGENTDAHGRYDVIEISNSIIGTHQLHDLVRISGDPAFLQAVSQILEREGGIDVESFSQREWVGMSNASQHLKNLIDDGRLYIHGPHAERLAEHLKNCTKNSGNRDDGMWRIGKIGKGRVLKNDGAVAAAISAVVASTVEDTPICVEIPL